MGWDERPGETHLLFLYKSRAEVLLVVAKKMARRRRPKTDKIKRVNKMEGRGDLN